MALTLCFRYRMLVGSIQISGSQISALQAKEISQSLVDHHVPSLTLRKCRAKDKSYRTIMKGIGKTKALIQLNLNLGLVSSKNRAYLLSDALLLNRSLTCLFLHGSKLGDKGTMIVCEALARHPQVRLIIELLIRVPDPHSPSNFANET